MKVWDLRLQRFFVGKCSPWQQTQWSRSELQHFFLLCSWCFSHWFYHLCYLGFTYLFTLSPVSNEQHKSLIIRGLTAFSGWTVSVLCSFLLSTLCYVSMELDKIPVVHLLQSAQGSFARQCLSVTTIFPILMFLWQEFFCLCSILIVRFIDSIW